MELLKESIPLLLAWDVGSWNLGVGRDCEAV
jgi:hypothetical protein